MKIKKYILEFTVFTCGAVVMIFELVGSRVLGPYVGTSIFVWTSLIGIILGSLSLGYYLGGKIADKKPDYRALSFIIFVSAICIGLTTLIKEPVLIFLQNAFANIKISSTIASLILFMPASVLMGMVSPYAAKLRISSLDNSGSTIGNLYALSTVGSIVGTFLSGFYLIPTFGTNKLLIILTAILLIVSLSLTSKQLSKIKLCVLCISILGLATSDELTKLLGKSNVIDVDTTYNRIWIYDHTDSKTGKPTKVMGINNENHSSMFLDSDELVNEYTKYYHLARHFNPDFKKTLMLGGAGYSFPKDFLLTYPDASIDVVEIDPMMTTLAKQYFRLPENPRLHILHEDGRVFLNKATETYDIIFGDAFGSRYSIPYQLTTQEAVQREFDILSNNGVVILNTISAIEGEQGQFLRAEYATYKKIFPQVYVLPVRDAQDEEKTQNIMLVALKSRQKPVFTNVDPQLNNYLQHTWTKEIVMDMPILTDDFAPVDYYINKAI